MSSHGDYREHHDSHFRIVPALNAAFLGAVSIECVSKPGHYLRHYSFELHAHMNDNSPVFASDASFFIRPSEMGQSSFSFESTNFPNHFVCHNNFVMFVRQRQDPMADFTFHLNAVMAGMIGQQFAIQSFNFPDHLVKIEGIIVKYYYY